MTPTRKTTPPAGYDEATLAKLGARRTALLEELKTLTPQIREQVIAGARAGMTAYRLAKVAGMTTTAASQILHDAGIPTARRAPAA